MSLLLGEKIPVSFIEDDCSINIKTVNSEVIIDKGSVKITNKAHDGTLTVLNPDDTCVFETNRDRERYPELFESYSWGGNNDEFPNGPSAVAMTIQFSGTNLHFSGLPEYTLPLNIPNTDDEPIRFFNTDINQYEVNSPMAMYVAIPLVLGHADDTTTGLFWLTSETWVDVNDSTLRFMSESGYIDLFLWNGKPSQILDGYTQLTGRPMLAPGFTLGFHQCRWGYMSADELKTVSKRMDELMVSHDAVWADLDYTDDKKYFIFNKNNSKDPKELTNFFAHNHRYLVTFHDPHIKVDSSYYV